MAIIAPNNGKYPSMKPRIRIGPELMPRPKPNSPAHEGGWSGRRRFGGLRTNHPRASYASSFILTQAEFARR